MIEVRATGNASPLGMAPKRFLREFWQKRPLVVRGAFAGFVDPLLPDDLAGLACEEMALSRIVIHQRSRDRWQLRNGPFSAADFSRLPTHDWTLLVQDVDKWDVDVAALLDRFTFLPRWRIDDVMVSYAVDGGSVGAHVDQYDVFLLQGRGRRRWRISTDTRAPQGLRDDAEIKLLSEFAPTHEWVLQAGDMLYLPPGVPHHGVAVGECLTYSIGMRAPSLSDLLLDFAESFAETLPDGLRYCDPELVPASADGEIDDAALARVVRAMPWLRVLHSGKKSAKRERGTDGCSGSVDSSLLRTWFGRFITRYRSAHAAVPRSRPIADAVFDRAFAERSEAVRNPWSRLAWTRTPRGAMLFVAGTEHDCSIAFAELACSRSSIPLERVRPGRDRDTLRSLIDLGHVTLNAPKRRSPR